VKREMPQGHRMTERQPDGQKPNTIVKATIISSNAEQNKARKIHE